MIGTFPMLYLNLMTLGTFWIVLSKQKGQQDDKNLHNKIIKVNNEIE